MFGLSSSATQAVSVPAVRIFLLSSPFADMTEEDLSLYTIQLSLYALMLEDIGIPIISRCLIWLKDGDYQVVPVKSVTEELRQTL